MKKGRVYIFVGVSLLLALVYICTVLLRDWFIIQMGIKTLKLLQYGLIGLEIGNFLGLLIPTVVGVHKVRIAEIEEKQAAEQEEADKAAEREQAFSGLHLKSSKDLSSAIFNCLEETQMTHVFSEKLGIISKLVGKADARVNRLLEMAEGEFGAGSLSYNQFTKPVKELYARLINSGVDLVEQLSVFDSCDYLDKLHEAKSPSTRKEYEKVLTAHQDFAESVENAFEQAVLKFDQLQLEISRLGFDNVKGAEETIQELDKVIEKAKLWKEE